MTSNLQNSQTANVKLAINGNLVWEPKEFGLRLFGNLAILSVIFLLTFITILFSTNLVANKINLVRDCFYEYVAKQGFILDDVIVTGREKTQKEDIAQIVSLKRGDNFLRINIQKIKKDLEQLPWVKRALVKRTFFPNVIQISLKERDVRSIWQLHDKFYPIDYDGKVIDATFEPKTPILLIVGEGAPENINSLLEDIGENKHILQRVKVANFVSGRRWNLILDDIKNGVTIKLPEENVKKAWKKLLKLDATNGILKRKLTILDLRLDDKVTVKLKRNSEDKPIQLRDIKERRT